MIRFTKAAATLKPPKKPKGGKKAVLDELRAFLDQAEPETVSFLLSGWDAQQNAVTYKELREAFLSGGVSQAQFEQWQKDYSKLITGALAPKWEAAAAAAAQEVRARYPRFLYEPSVGAGMAYIQQHGAELVTNLAQEQRQALNAVIQHVSGYTAVTPDEAARIIRPCIGLTKPQALANARYRESVKQAYLKAHPRGKPETAEKRAADAAARYAARQHRYRAQNIARTELAYAYNAGAYGATKDAQARGYIGDCVKVWLTAYDERVCPVCSAMDDEKRNMDELFSNGKLLPPAHPSCRCAVAYEEIPGTNLTAQQNDVTINAAEENAHASEFIHEDDELRERRWIQYGEEREFKRNKKTIKAKKVENFSENNLFLEDGVKISKSAMRRLNKRISKAKALMGITGVCNVPIVITLDNPDNPKDSIAAYNPRTDVIFFSSILASEKLPMDKLQIYACPTNPLSTIVHEMFHWQDAYEYRKSGKVINDAESLEAYTVYQLENCRCKLIQAGVDLDDAYGIRCNISKYAEEQLMKNQLEEVFAEYRTKQLLGEDK